MNWIVWLRTHTEKRSVTWPICNRSLIFLKKSYRFLKIMTCWMEAIWEYRTTNTLHVDRWSSSQVSCESRSRRIDWHLHETDVQFTMDQVVTYSVSSQHEQRMMKNNEELIKLLQTETAHIVKTNEQSLKQTKPILRTSSRRSDPVDDWYWQDVRQRLVSHIWALYEISGYDWCWYERGWCKWNERKQLRDDDKWQLFNKRLQLSRGVSIPSFQHVTECTWHRHCTTNIVFLLFVVFFPFVLRQTQLSCTIHSLTSVCAHPHLDRTGLFVFFCLFRETSVIVTSHMVADTSLDIMQFRWKVRFYAQRGWRSAQQKTEKEWCWRFCCFCSEFQTIRLRIPGHQGAEIQFDFTEVHKILGSKAQRAILRIEKIHRKVWFSTLILMNVVFMLRNLMTDLKKKPWNKNDARGKWEKVFSSSRKGQGYILFAFGSLVSTGAISTETREEIICGKLP